MIHIYTVPAQKWKESKRSLISNYLSHEILNSEHCSFQQEYVPPETLSFTDKRTTEVASKKKKLYKTFVSSSSIASAKCQLLDKFMPILQEKKMNLVKKCKKYNHSTKFYCTTLKIWEKQYRKAQYFFRCCFCGHWWIEKDGGGFAS